MDSAPASSHRSALSLAILLAALTLALFWPATGFDYVKLDDDQYVASNPHVLTGLTAANIRWAFTTVYEDWWLPLLWLSYMLDTEFFGAEPFGYHLTNILLHAANAALLFWFLYRATNSRWRSFFAAALFAVHPLRVESVAWITARKDVLSGLFFFLCLLAYLRYVEKPTALRMGLVTAGMLLGLMSKAILVILPFALLLLDNWPLQRAGPPGGGAGAWTRWRPYVAEKIPLFLLCGLFILVNLRTHVSGSGADSTLDWATRLGLIFPNYWAYLAKIFWPTRLAILYPEQDVVRWTLALIATGGIVLLTWLFSRARNAAPCLLMGWLWFLLALFPVIRGVRLGLAAMNDRFTYLPSIGLGIALVWGADTLAQLWPRHGRRLAAFVGLLLLVIWAALSRHYLPFWRNSLAMFSRLVQLEPENDLANLSYGRALVEAGRLEESLRYSARAADANPSASIAVLNHTDTLIRLGRYEEAFARLDRARAQGFPTSVEFHLLYALALLGADRAADALPHLRQALALRPAERGARVELARAFFETGQPIEAHHELLRLQTDGLPHLRDFDSLAAHYAITGPANPHYTWSFFANNLLRFPDRLSLLNNAAWFLATMKNPPAPPAEAVRLARRAAELAPAPHPGILDTLAAALASNGQFDKAIQTAQQALNLAREAGDLALAADLQRRLDAYSHNQPWRAGP